MGLLNMSSGRVKFCFKEGSVSLKETETESKQKCSGSEILSKTFVFYFYFLFFFLVFSVGRNSLLGSRSFVRFFKLLFLILYFAQHSKYFVTVYFSSKYYF